MGPGEPRPASVTTACNPDLEAHGPRTSADRPYASADLPPTQGEPAGLFRPSSPTHCIELTAKNQNDFICHLENQDAYRYSVNVEMAHKRACALIDSGNLWRVAISEDFYNQLPARFRLLRTIPGIDQVGTAKQGAGLRVLGELATPVPLRFGGHPTIFKCRPAVLQGLSRDINISGPFLKQYHIDQLHSQDAIRVQGRIIPLRENEGAPTGRHVSAVHLDQDVVVPAHAERVVRLRAPEVVAGDMDAGTCYLRGGTEFGERARVAPWRNAVVTCNKDGRTYGGLMNTTDEPITVRAGMRYGDITLTADPDQPIPGRLLLLDPKQPKQQKGAELKSTERSPLWTRASKIDHLLKTFQLRQSPYLQNEEDLARALALLIKHWDTFAWDGSFGTTTLVEHEIHTTTEKPINTRYRPPNPQLEPSLRAQVDKWLQHDVVEPSNSPWNFGLVAVPKKSGEIRWCIDYRPLNDITVKDSHPIGHIDDTLCRLAHSRIFSTLDGSGAYHVVPVREQDRPKTSFATPFGAYQFKKMPFGLCNAPSTYARLVQRVLEGIPYQQALPYLDDTLVHSRSLAEHLRSLEATMTAHRRAGLKLNPQKCTFFADKAEYLGHVVSKEGLSPIPAYVEVVQNWPLPNTRHKTRQFLGKTGYYRRYIKHYQAIINPMQAMTEGNDKADDHKIFVPDEAFRKSFALLKERLLSAPILAFPDFQSEEPFILDTDWSAENNAIGAVLSQKQDGHERVIAYGAHKLTKAQGNYSPNKGELAAAIIFMKKWKYYLQHRPFLLRTDHRALKWMHTMDPPTGVISRWLDTLANYNFDIEHRAGKKHTNADALSRVDHALTAQELTDISDENDRQLLIIEQDLMKTIKEIRKGDGTDSQWSLEEWVSAQKNDDDLAWIRPFVEKKQAPPTQEVVSQSPVAQRYAEYFDSLHVGANDLLRIWREPRGHETKRRSLALVPQDMWDVAIQRAHLASAHLAVDNTVERAQRSIYFPNMKAVAQRVLRRCLPCQLKGKKPADQRHTLSSQFDGYPFMTMAVDFVGPLPTSKSGNQYLFTVRDTCSRWLEAFPVRRANAKAAISKLVKDVFPRFGLPLTLKSDRGSHFTANFATDVAEVLGIPWHNTPAWNPKSNPVERAHRDLNSILTALCCKEPRMWEEYLPQALFALRTTRCRSTGMSPFEMLFARHATTNLDLLFGDPPGRNIHGDASEYAQDLKKRMQAAHKWARKNMHMAIERQKRAYHKDKQFFAPGDKVWLFTPQLKKGEKKKFHTYWTGPWTVHEKINDVVYRLAPHEAWKRRGQEVVSVDRLKRYYGIDEDQQEATVSPPDPEADLRMVGDEHAENIDNWEDWDEPEVEEPLVTVGDHGNDDDDGGPPPPQPQPQPPQPQLPPPVPPRPRAPSPQPMEQQPPEPPPRPLARPRGRPRGPREGPPRHLRDLQAEAAAFAGTVRGRTRAQQARFDERGGAPPQNVEPEAPEAAAAPLPVRRQDSGTSSSDSNRSFSTAESDLEDAG